MQRRVAVPALCAAILLSACVSRTAGPQVDVAAEEQAIRDRSMAWLQAAKAKDHAAEAAFFADDGMMFRENDPPQTGPAAVQQAFAAEAAEDPNGTVEWTTDAVHVAASGDLGYELGTYTSNSTGPNGPVTDTGKFVTVWKKVNGEWKVAADMSLSTVPEAPPTTTTSN